VTIMIKSKEQIRSDYRRTEALNEAKDARKGTNGITKRSVTYHKATAEVAASDTVKDAGELTDFNTAVMAPTEEQLSRINQFTRTPKTADELVVFNTLSCNTMADRDDDYFDEGTVRGFAELPSPYGPIGKSYMVGHDYTKLPTGRIFGAGTKDAVTTLFMTNEVYVPNTEQYKAFIENIDFGINWAVSVGVMLEAQLCSICQEDQFSFWGMAFCATGHWKGSYYEPGETRTDDWGDIIEAKPGDPSAVKCLGNMHGAKDFYELSQVFLGAQFNAQLESPSGDKAAAMAAAKSAVSKGVYFSKTLPILGMSREEAEALPLQRVDAKVAEALEKFDVTRDNDGSIKWADAEGLIWLSAPGEPVTCLGRNAVKDATEGEDDDDAEREEDEPIAADDPEASGAGEGGSDLEGEGEHDDGGGSAEGGGPDDSGVDDGDPDEERSGGDLSEDDASGDDDNQKGANSAMSKAKVLAALKRVKAPAVLLDAVNNAEDDTALDEVLRAAASSLGAMSTELNGLRPKAALGEQFIKSKRADAIAAYVKSQVGSEQGVDTARFEKMLDSFGDDVEQIEFVTEQYAQQAKSKLPAGIRRSTEPADPNSHGQPLHGSPGNEQELSATGRRVVSRIHG
jgi:hypothetical protein